MMKYYSLYDNFITELIHFNDVYDLELYIVKQYNKLQDGTQ